jgi:hypothetical protein
MDWPLMSTLSRAVLSRAVLTEHSESRGAGAQGLDVAREGSVVGLTHGGDVQVVLAHDGVARVQVGGEDPVVNEHDGAPAPRAVRPDHVLVSLLLHLTVERHIPALRHRHTLGPSLP